MRIKKLSRERIVKLEKAVEDGVYVAPERMLKRQDFVTKKLIEQMKRSKHSYSVPITTRNYERDNQS